MTITDNTNRTSDTGQADQADQERTEELIKQARERLATVHATEQPGTDDIVPGSVEALLRLNLPGHTFFQTDTAVPRIIRQIIEQTGADAGAIEGAPKRRNAIFTTPKGIYIVQVTSYHGEDHGYRVEIDAPDTEVKRSVATPEDVIRLLHRFDVILEVILDGVE